LQTFKEAFLQTEMIDYIALFDDEIEELKDKLSNRDYGEDFHQAVPIFH